MRHSRAKRRGLAKRWKAATRHVAKRRLHSRLMRLARKMRHAGSHSRVRFQNTIARMNRRGVLSNAFVEDLLKRSSIRTCYACDAAAVGLRDLRYKGGKIERACRRHAERLD